MATKIEQLVKLVEDVVQEHLEVLDDQYAENLLCADEHTDMVGHWAAVAVQARRIRDEG